MDLQKLCEQDHVIRGLDATRRDPAIDEYTASALENAITVRANALAGNAPIETVTAELVDDPSTLKTSDMLADLVKSLESGETGLEDYPEIDDLLAFVADAKGVSAIDFSAQPEDNIFWKVESGVLYMRSEGNLEWSKIEATQEVTAEAEETQQGDLGLPKTKEERSTELKALHIPDLQKITGDGEPGWKKDDYIAAVLKSEGYPDDQAKDDDHS